MKKAIYVLLTLVQVLLIAGAAIVQNYSKKKMGVVRYLEYKNAELGEFWFSDTAIKVYAAFFIITAIISTGIIIAKNRKMEWAMVLELFLCVLIGLAGGYFAIFGTLGDYMGLYAIILAIGISLGLQIIKTLFFNRPCGVKV